ncbi:MAG: GAF domain-containing protein [Actinobacteria bacterium]|nr:GAF domain-containing protein [Actinomycetota bacterium]
MDHEAQLEVLLQRQKLFERLARIQRSISHHAALPSVLDSITAGASELLGDEVVGLRLIDEDDPSYCVLASTCGLSPETLDAIRRTPLGQGVGGLAIQENRLVVEQEYANAALGHPLLIEKGLRAAMAAPVHQGDEVVGSLLVASCEPHRNYTPCEQDALIAFAQHASLALSDARSIESLRESQRSQEMFFAMVSHELKTPLTAIMGLLLTLRRHYQALPDDVRDELISNSYERAQDLKRLIDNLLAGAKAELAAEPVPAFLPEVIGDALKGFDHSRTVSVANLPEVTLVVDARAVRDILGILLENALSHSPEGTDISVEALVESGRVSIGVHNLGTLPDDVDYSRLFSAFQRGAPADGAAGVGLGLFIASKLARSLNGVIDVSSARGQVSFILSLPLQASLEPTGR